VNACKVKGKRTYSIPDRIVGKILAPSLWQPNHSVLNLVVAAVLRDGRVMEAQKLR